MRLSLPDEFGVVREQLGDLFKHVRGVVRVPLGFVEFARA